MREEVKGCVFFTGTHQPQWLGLWSARLFVSRRRLVGRKTLPVARAPWALDSGGFTEIAMHGKWTVSPREYAADATRFQRNVGNMKWAATQDWMCEPAMLAKTGLSVVVHQDKSIQSVLDLRAIAPHIPWAPVLQGWVLKDYLVCVDKYEKAGIDLTKENIVGVGSVCRRQHSDEVRDIFAALHARGLRLHGFGVKLKGLEKAAKYLVSADSMSWSVAARHKPPLPECRGHKNCANCIRFAARWRKGVIDINGMQRTLGRDRLVDMGLA